MGEKMGEKQGGGKKPKSHRHRWVLIGDIKASPSRNLFGCGCGYIGFSDGVEVQEFCLGVFQEAVQNFARRKKDFPEGVMNVIVHINTTGARMGYGRGFTI